MMIFNKLFSAQSSYKNRKVVNTAAVILAAKQHGLTYEKVGCLCGVSKTTVSNWGSPTKQNLATYNQIEPLIKAVGSGLLKIELYPLSPAAIEESSRVVDVFIVLIMIIFLFGSIWFFSWKPCSDNWSQCKQLKWYKMPVYDSIELKKNLQEFKEYKLKKL